MGVKVKTKPVYLAEAYSFATREDVHLFAATAGREN
jgi:hypothetical protein